jgi:hypothetical protein
MWFASSDVARDQLGRVYDELGRAASKPSSLPISAMTLSRQSMASLRALAVVMGSPFVKWITTQRNAQVIQRQQF